MASTRKPTVARLEGERRRRAAASARLAAARAADLAARTARIVAELAARRLEDIRIQLRVAARRHAAQRLLEEALAPTHAFGWVPWGYELAAEPEPVEMPAAVPPVPQLRLVHSLPGPRTTARPAVDAARPRVLAVMAA